YHHDQRPDKERNRAHDVVGGGRNRARAVEACLQRVERARADISEHDAQRAKRQKAEAAARGLACPRCHRLRGRQETRVLFRSPPPEDRPSAELPDREGNFTVAISLHRRSAAFTPLSDAHVAARTQTYA